MIAHVAEKGEDRGRVVLQIGPSAELSAAAAEGAARVARAFGSEIECLFVEEAGLVDSTGFAFVREVSFSGRQTRALSLADIEHGWRAAARSMQNRIAELAGRAEVPVRFRTVRDTIATALASACADFGPWNIVAIGEPLGATRAAGIGDLFAAVQGTTGILVAGHHAKCSAGPVVAIVETIERVAPMWRAAERIAAVTGSEASLLIVSREHENLNWIEGQARLALGGDAAANVAIAVLAQTEPLAVAECLHRKRAGIVIAQYGGAAAPAGVDLAALATALDGVILLVR